jgi:large subunit ribosomal protein L6
MSTRARLEAPPRVEVKVPEGVKARLEGTTLIVEGPLGRNVKDFSKIPVTLKVEDDTIYIETRTNRRREVAVRNTARSLVRNLIHGVQKGFAYKMKIVYAHFPINVRVEGGTVYIENFYGERAPRVAKIVGETKVEPRGDDVVVKGINLEHVSQTAANIEQATKVKRKDPRIFLDGIYIYEKHRTMEV